MAGAIILTLTSTIPGKDITDTAATIRSSTIVEAAASGMREAAAFTAVAAVEATAAAVAAIVEISW
jgi:hypothetical protein